MRTQLPLKQVNYALEKITVVQNCITFSATEEINHIFVRFLNLDTSNDDAGSVKPLPNEEMEREILAKEYTEEDKEES